MWRHPYRAFSTVVDEVMTSSNVLFEFHRGFSKTTDPNPPSFEATIADTRARPSKIRWDEKESRGRFVRVPVSIPTLDYETYFDYYQSGEKSADTLVIHHHGLGEIQHDLPPRLVFSWNRRLRRRCDWIAIKGAYHKNFREVSMKLMHSRDSFYRFLICSASVPKEIARSLRHKYKYLVISGISLGGLISLVENIVEPEFDLVLPIVAGPNIPDVMFRSAFRKLLQSRYLRDEKKAPWLHLFDMTWRLENTEGPPICPMLARSDRVFRYSVQREAYSRIDRATVTSIEGGHVTGAANIYMLSRHLETQLKKHCWNR